MRNGRHLLLACLASLTWLGCSDPGAEKGDLEAMAVSRPSPKRPTPAPAATEKPLPAPPATVIVLRHAEKAATGGKDPDLSPEGLARAKLLVPMFAKTGITAIYASHYVRTQQTAQPLAEKLGLPVEVVLASDIDALVRRVLQHSGGTVLVVAHSDSVGSIIEGLGGPRIEPIDETDFDNLYIVSFDEQRKGKVIPLQFGAPT